MGLGRARQSLHRKAEAEPQLWPGPITQGHARPSPSTSTQPVALPPSAPTQNQLRRSNGKSRHRTALLDLSPRLSDHSALRRAIQGVQGALGRRRKEFAARRQGGDSRAATRGETRPLRMQ